MAKCNPPSHTSKKKRSEQKKNRLQNFDFDAAFLPQKTAWIHNFCPYPTEAKKKGVNFSFDFPEDKIFF